MKDIKLYASGSIINAANIEAIAERLSPSGVTLLMPHELAPLDTTHNRYPVEIFEGCIRLMEEADACLLLLDCYGNDSSWECGWFCARRKPVIGFAETSPRFLEDWMIKGGLSAVITCNGRMQTVIEQDPFLSKPAKTVVGIREIEGLGECLRRVTSDLCAAMRSDTGLEWK